MSGGFRHGHGSIRFFRSATFTSSQKAFLEAGHKIRSAALSVTIGQFLARGEFPG
jgi:hypothetical protein